MTFLDLLTGFTIYDLGATVFILFDASILSSLRQGTTFFASSTMLAIGGGFAVIGNSDQLAELATDFQIERVPVLVWDIKIAFVLLFVTNSFLKFVWAHRLFGYCSVVMASVPNDTNRGLRSIYFAIAALFWLVGPLYLVVATLFTLFIIWRREFNSYSRTVLLQSESPSD